MQLNRMNKFSPHTNEVIYEVETMSADQVDITCREAKTAFAHWSRISIDERKHYLRKLIDAIHKNRESIIRSITLDVGKPYCEAETEVIESCDILEYYCSETYEGIDAPIEIPLDDSVWPYKKAYGLFQPCGVYAVIKPWNYPFELGIWSFAPLLIAGNTIVYKPSELSNATGIVLAELFNLADFPQGVFNIVQGNGTTGKYLVANNKISGISFTGSSHVGREIYNSVKCSNVKLSLEMGGSDFAVVLSDEIDHITLPGVLWGSFTNAGQVCVSIEKILISDKIYDSFLDQLVAETKKLEPYTEIPPLISRKQYLHALNIIDNALEHGGTVLCGGVADKGNDLCESYYVPPTIIECKDYKFLVDIGEIFAPIVLVAPFKNEEEAIELINSSEYGLGCSIWTGNYKKHIDLYKQLNVGMVWINEVNLPMPQVPWIGIKRSGVGFNLSKNAVYDAMNFKAIHIDNDRDKRVWWYPYEIK